MVLAVLAAHFVLVDGSPNPQWLVIVTCCNSIVGRLSGRSVLAESEGRQRKISTWVLRSRRQMKFTSEIFHHSS